ncbi:hypothetical protein [Aureispira anguillae]|uniref:Uncharacterized protein n=1 Tax=Aureispira anguillae TaxID=2864201 RepID=A0A915YCW4_9BACT|nr:hypothetical protein [Aureispira anguillae]BDS10772.1 hypothetical protein AsAng_0014810 [Aureispira anguillae]
MKILPNISYFFILFFVFGITENNYSQNRHTRPRFLKKHKKSILDNLPTFFVDDSRLPLYMKQIYKRDAARISIRLLNKELRISQQTVQIPEELVQAIYNAMVAVRTSNYSAVDTMVNQYYIRTFPVPNVEKIILIAEHDAPWLKPLKHREDTTGNSQINAIIRAHDLSISKLVHIDEERVALVLQSRTPINIPALMMRFFVEKGIGSIEEVLPYGDGNDIHIERTKKGWELVYSLKFGNCSFQCQKYHNWSYSIQEDGAVSYNGSSGYTIPPWITKSREGNKYPDVLVSKR